MKPKKLKHRRLSKRQTEILVLLSKGIAQKDMSEIHGVSVYSIRDTAMDLYRSLGVHNAAEAVSEGYQLGYLKVIK